MKSQDRGYVYGGSWDRVTRDSQSPSRNGSVASPYPSLDAISLGITGFPRFPVRSRRNH